MQYCSIKTLMHFSKQAHTALQSIVYWFQKALLGVFGRGVPA
jgi:hypothetical protein